MINRRDLQFLGIFLALSWFMISCGSSHHYGDRSEKYSRARRPGQSKPSQVYSEEKPVTAASSKEKRSDKPSTTSTGTLRNAMVEEAHQYIGTPYKYAGKSPQEGFDCSGFANFIYQKFGFQTSGPSQELALLGAPKERSQLQPGDLIFFGNEERISHVGIVISDKADRLTFIHSSTSAGIRTDVVNGSEYWEKRYLFGRDLISGFIAAK
jgi:cell wall-associated NlpC family hydrolase